MRAISTQPSDFDLVWLRCLFTIVGLWLMPKMSIWFKSRVHCTVRSTLSEISVYFGRIYEQREMRTGLWRFQDHFLVLFFISHFFFHSFLFGRENQQSDGRQCDTKNKPTYLFYRLHHRYSQTSFQFKNHFMWIFFLFLVHLVHFKLKWRKTQ